MSLGRNSVTKLYKGSLQRYFDTKCNIINGSKKCYDMIRPFLSNKCSRFSGSTIILWENNDDVTNPSKIAEIFNDYYASIYEYKNEPDDLAECDLHYILQSIVTTAACHSLNYMWAKFFKSINLISLPYQKSTKKF